MIDTTHLKSNNGPIIIDAHPDDRMRYVPYYTKEWLTGVRSLKPEDIGIYQVILTLIYEHMGNLPDDDRYIAGHCDCDVRRYQRIRAKLVEEGKIYEADGRLYNNRAMAEIAKFCAASRKKRETALLREAEKRRARGGETAEAPAPSLRILREFGAGLAQDSHGTGAEPAQDPRKNGSQKTQKTNDFNGGDTTSLPQSRHNHITTQPEQRVKIETYKESTHTQTPALPPRAARDDGDRVCVEIPDLVLPDPVRVTKPQPNPREARPGEKDLGNCLFESEREIRHPSFTISLDALTMQLVTANLGLSTIEARDVARKTALANGTQWAAEIANGKLSQDVLPYSIPNALRASVVKQRQKQRERTPAGAGAAPAHLRR